MKKTILFISVLFLCFAGKCQEQPDQNQGVIDANQAQHEGNDEDEQATDDFAGAVEGAITGLQGFIGTMQQTQDQWNTITNFTPNECTPDFSANGSSMMPSTCTGNQACSECYEKAVGELNFIRRQLGRLSCIYNNTKNFNESAVAFGDNMSGIHAVTGAAWQSARGEVMAEFQSFKHTYDNKYTDMMGALQRALQGIGACEAQYGGMTDWYQRFGFIYFEFMKDKYKRND